MVCRALPHGRTSIESPLENSGVEDLCFLPGIRSYNRADMLMSSNVEAYIIVGDFFLSVGDWPESSQKKFRTDGGSTVFST